MSSKNPLIKISLILLVALVTGCYYDSEERLYPTVYSPCDDVTVTFSRTVTQILHSCQSCHSNSDAASSGNNIKLETFDQVKAYILSGKLMGAINHVPGYVPMPKGGGKLADCEINQLQNWINNQTPNN